MSDGLSIRPQTLRLTPQYRRLRDSILRPHLRLTESRYFWERWKSRLGPEATVLIMEVRDRCNHALAPPAHYLHPTDTTHAPGVSDLPNAAGEDSQTADGCTVSASELAAACGFSRVTLWRILQREDVRRFISVEHNYVYDRRLGKKRRTVSTYRVQMEDPLLEEDEQRLQALLEAQGLRETQEVPLAPGALPPPAEVQERHRQAAPLPRPRVHFATEVVDNSAPRLHPETATGESIPKPQNVQETIVKERLGPNGRTAPHTMPSHTPFHSEWQEIDIWQKYPEIAHYVEEAEKFLGDQHSRGFYIQSLKRLYPGHMDVWQRALGLAREQQRIRRSRGALFTRLLRTFAAEAGISL